MCILQWQQPPVEYCCAVCCPVAATKIKGTSVWIPFSQHLVVIRYSLQKLSLCLKNFSNVFQTQSTLESLWNTLRLCSLRMTTWVGVFLGQALQ